MTRRGHATDRHRDRHRTGGGWDGFVAHAGQQTLGGDRQLIGRATGQHYAELVAGETAEMVLGAQPRTDALGDLRNDLLGHLEAVSLVEPAEMIDGDQQKTAGAAKLHRVLERGAKRLDQAGAVQLTGGRIEIGALDELALAFVTRADRAHDSLRAQRLAIPTGEPAAGILQPDFLVAALEGVLHLVGNALAGVAQDGLLDRVDAGLAALGIDKAGVGPAAANFSCVGNPEDRSGVLAPAHCVGIQPPYIGDVTNRSKNLVSVRDAGSGSKTGHARPFLERHAVPGVAFRTGCSGKTTGYP